jgi:lysophospholipase L1-like esterase
MTEPRSKAQPGAQPLPPKTRKRTVLAALLVLSVFTLAVVEVALRIALPTADFLQADLRDDPVLGLMIAPHDNGHDANGFRNASVPTQTDILAVGDSFTYGYNAPRSSSWPGHLQRITGQSVYNTGVGGFGPLQELHVTQQWAPKLKPKTVVMAIFLGNDITDAYNLAQSRTHWHPWRITARPPEARTALDELADREWAEQESKRFAAPLRDWLSLHSMTYSVLRTTVLTPLAAMRASKQVAAADPNDKMPWLDAQNPAQNTVFNARQRLMALDPAQTETQEGLQITERALQAMQAQATAQGYRLVVALIPTKERAHCKRLLSAGVTLPPTHARLCEVEPQVTRRLMAAAAAAGITTVDTSVALIDAVMAKRVLYLKNEDAHPNADGYEVIAGEIARALKR